MPPSQLSHPEPKCSSSRIWTAGAASSAAGISTTVPPLAGAVMIEAAVVPSNGTIGQPTGSCGRNGRNATSGVGLVVVGARVKLRRRPPLRFAKPADVGGIPIPPVRGSVRIHETSVVRDGGIPLVRGFCLPGRSGPGKTNCALRSPWRAGGRQVSGLVIRTARLRGRAVVFLVSGHTPCAVRGHTSAVDIAGGVTKTLRLTPGAPNPSAIDTRNALPSSGVAPTLRLGRLRPSAVVPGKAICRKLAGGMPACTRISVCRSSAKLRRVAAAAGTVQRSPAIGACGTCVINRRFGVGNSKDEFRPVILSCLVSARRTCIRPSNFAVRGVTYRSATFERRGGSGIRNIGANGANSAPAPYARGCRNPRVPSAVLHINRAGDI